MRIGLLHYSSPPVVGGVESVLAHHARLMANAGHEVTILTGRGGTFDERIRVRVLPRLDSRHADVLAIKAELDIGNYTPHFDELCRLIQEELLAELQECDVLIAHNVASLHKNLPLTAALHRAYQISGFPHLILWNHDFAWTPSRNRQGLHDGYPWDLLRTHWEGVTQVVVSASRKQELVELFEVANHLIRVIPNGVDLDAFFKLEPQTIKLIECLNLMQANPLFLLPVRLTPRKNIEFALKVIAELRSEFPEVMLLVTGPEGPHNPMNAAYKHELFQLRDELKLNGVVHFLAETNSEFVPDAIIADFYRLADALLFPSREEGFGIPIIEAAFSRMPVFCADIPVLRELGNDEVSYFSLEAAPRSVSQQIAERLKGEMTARWVRRAKQDYTWQQIYSLHIAPLIQEVCL